MLYFILFGDRKMKIGIFGGSFNPIHNAHVFMANKISMDFDLDKCFIIPTKVSPFKIANNNSIPDHFRIEMINYAIRDFPKLELCDFEIKSNDISYTYLTIDYLKKNYNSAKFYLFIGTDQALSFERWKNWEYILDNVVILIARRPDLKSDREKIEIEEFFDSKCEYHFVDAPIININSTMIRENIKNNISISDMVNPLVEEFIMRNRLYR